MLSLELTLGPGRIEEVLLDWRYRYMNAGLAPDPRVVVVRFDGGPYREALAGASTATLHADDLLQVVDSILLFRPRAILMEGLPELPAGLAETLADIASGSSRLSLPVWTDKPLQMDSVRAFQAAEDPALEDAHRVTEIVALQVIRTDAHPESTVYALHALRHPGLVPLQAARALHIVSLPLDLDAVARRAPLLFRLEGGNYLPGPGLRALWLDGRVDSVVLEADSLTLVSPQRTRETLSHEDGAMRIHYYPPRAYLPARRGSDVTRFRIFSGVEVRESLDLLQNRQVFRFEELPVLPDEFENVFVIVDLASPTLDTPIGPLPRSYVQATVLSNLLQGHHLKEVGALWGWLLACLTAWSIGGFVVLGRSGVTRAILPLFISVFPLLAGAVAFSYRIGLPLSQHLVATVATLSFVFPLRRFLSKPDTR